MWYVDRFIAGLLGKGLVTSEGKVHAMHKRLMMPSFNTSSIASQSQLRQVWLH